MIYQSSHQIMFVNYMPFLCSTFWGIDRYFEQKKSGLLISGTFLMIMTSFYFSIGGILALGLYGIYRYARTKERAEEMITVKGFLGDGLRFAGRDPDGNHACRSSPCADCDGSSRGEAEAGEKKQISSDF